MAKKVEFCYAPPSISPLYVSKTAAYSTGMQPGSASWSFFKTAQLASPYTNNIASLFRGDTAVSDCPDGRRILWVSDQQPALVCFSTHRANTVCVFPRCT
jgi:hypothetical protein